MSTLWKDIKFKMLHSGSRVMLLVWINIIVFLVIFVPATIEQLFSGFGRPSVITTEVYEYLSLPSYLPKLLHRPWTPFTYMFIHAGIFHILFNMLWLYWMGQIFEEYLGNKRTVGLYILGGLSGAFFFVAAYNIFPYFSHTDLVALSTNVGASAAIMAIIVATATLVPDYTIYLFIIGPVRLKWLALFFVVLDFLSISGLNAGGEISHLGGALFGFIYIKQLQRGNDIVGFFANQFKKRSKLKVAAKNGAQNTGSKPRQEEVDRILDKISRTGYDSLSKQEKEILFRASKDNES
ncbi:MAG: rhomboid family intramembrane serine protease [Bacteroidetes bacterium]|nr:rhomboid family intramembrane serine protease [Bacteroidota bacterium]